MRLHKTRSTCDRSIPRSLQNMSFDEILDLTADVFSFYTIYNKKLASYPKKRHFLLYCSTLYRDHYVREYNERFLVISDIKRAL